jgi:hypothetical protein
LSIRDKSELELGTRIKRILRIKRMLENIKKIFFILQIRASCAFPDE